VLLHVIDISNANWREQAKAVEDVLAQLEVTKTPTIAVYNKADLIPAGPAEQAPALPDTGRFCFQQEPEPDSAHW